MRHQVSDDHSEDHSNDHSDEHSDEHGDEQHQDIDFRIMTVNVPI